MENVEIFEKYMTYVLTKEEVEYFISNYINIYAPLVNEIENKNKIISKLSEQIWMFNSTIYDLESEGTPYSFQSAQEYVYEIDKLEGRINQLKYDIGLLKKEIKKKREAIRVNLKKRN